MSPPGTSFYPWTHGELANLLKSSVAQQILASMRIIMGRDGTDIGLLEQGDFIHQCSLCVSGRKKIQQLADNAKFFRQGMKKMGFTIFGLF